MIPCRQDDFDYENNLISFLRICKKKSLFWASLKSSEIVSSMRLGRKVWPKSVHWMVRPSEKQRAVLPMIYLHMT